MNTQIPWSLLVSSHCLHSSSFLHKGRAAPSVIPGTFPTAPLKEWRPSHSVCRAASAILRLTCAFHFHSPAARARINEHVRIVNFSNAQPARARTFVLLTFLTLNRRAHTFILLTFLMHNRNEQGCPPSKARSTSKKVMGVQTTQAQLHLSPTLSKRTQVKAPTVDLRDGNADQATKTRLARTFVSLFSQAASHNLTRLGFELSIANQRALQNPPRARATNITYSKRRHP